MLIVVYSECRLCVANKLCVVILSSVTPLSLGCLTYVAQFKIHDYPHDKAPLPLDWL